MQIPQSVLCFFELKINQRVKEGNLPKHFVLLFEGEEARF